MQLHGLFQNSINPVLGTVSCVFERVKQFVTMNSRKSCFHNWVLTGFLVNKGKQSKSHYTQRCTLAIRMLYTTQAGWPWPESSTVLTMEADTIFTNYQLKAEEKKLGQNEIQKSIIRRNKLR